MLRIIIIVVCRSIASLSLWARVVTEHAYLRRWFAMIDDRWLGSRVVLGQQGT